MTLSEARFQSQVTQLAKYYGWAVYHAPDNKPGPHGRRQTVARGWPDLFMVRDGQAIAAELKTDKGRVRPEQVEWLAALDLVPGVETFLWRPADFDEVHARLARGRVKAQALYREEEAA